MAIITKLKLYLELIRVHQWYKNLVVFLALFFSQNITTIPLINQVLMAFFSLSCLSSVGYIINDWKDLDRDRLNPEKKQRPLVSGKVSGLVALLIALLFLILGTGLALKIGSEFLMYSMGFVLLSVSYSFLLKNMMLVDVLTISILFVLRALAGAAAIKVVPSPWLILVPFFLSLFVSIGKRHAELQLLKEKAYKTRTVLAEYYPELTNSLMIITTSLLILSYALYSFLSEHNNLLLTLPFALFVVFRYLYLIQKKSEIARHPHLLITDSSLVVGILIWIIITTVLIYG